MLHSTFAAFVKDVWTESLSEPVTVYNFEVAVAHTYFVSERNVLVHNKGCKSVISDKIKTGDAKKYSKHPSRRAAYRAAKRDAGVLRQQPIVTKAIDRRGHFIQGKTYNFKKGNDTLQILWHSKGHPEYGMTRHFNFGDWHYFY